MNDEKKQKLIQATVLMGQAHDLIKSVRDDQEMAYHAVPEEDCDKDYAFALQMDLDDLADIQDEVDHAQTSMVDLAERISKKRRDIVRTEEEEDKLIDALGWTREDVECRLQQAARFCRMLGLELKYEIK